VTCWPAAKIGRPVYFESHFDRFRPEVRERWREQAVPGAGLWVDLGAHLLDQAVQLFGTPDTLQLDTAALRDGALVEDYFHAVLRYEVGPHAPLRVVLHATTLAAHAAPRYIVHGTRGSYVKHGVDPQEDALRAGGRPGGDDWGADPDSANSRWWRSRTGCATVPYRAHVAATTSTTTPRCATPSSASDPTPCRRKRPSH
jgi:predicted dehydrogenase